MHLIVSIIKLSIVIRSPRAFLEGVQLQVSGLNFFSLIPVIGYPGDVQVNYARFNGFFRSVSFSFQNLGKSPTDIFAQKKFS